MGDISKISNNELETTFIETKEMLEMTLDQLTKKRDKEIVVIEGKYNPRIAKVLEKIQLLDTPTEINETEEGVKIAIG